MAVWNFTEGEIQCQLVYWGPAGSGKSSSLAAAHRALARRRGSRVERLGPDRLGLRLGRLEGVRTRLTLHAPPGGGDGRGRAGAAEVLEHADGVVFVADSSPSRVEDDMRCLADLEEALADLGRDPAGLPLVFQWNKRDLPGVLDERELAAVLDQGDRSAFPTVASEGVGVVHPVRVLGSTVLARSAEELGLRSLRARRSPGGAPGALSRAARAQPSSTGARTVVGVRARQRGLLALMTRPLRWARSAG